MNPSLRDWEQRVMSPERDIKVSLERSAGQHSLSKQRCQRTDHSNNDHSRECGGSRSEARRRLL